MMSVPRIDYGQPGAVDAAPGHHFGGPCVTTINRDGVLSQDGEPRRIPLYRSSLVAIVDAEDYGWLSQMRWRLWPCKSGNVYAASRTEHGRYLFMHRLLFAAPEGMDIDHANGNGLDNRLVNLRAATRQQNSANSRRRGRSSRFKGVCWDKSRGLWLAGVKFDYRRINLGRFAVEEDAARAYDKKARELFGAFARTNFDTIDKVVV